MKNKEIKTIMKSSVVDAAELTFLVIIIYLIATILGIVTNGLSFMSDLEETKTKIGELLFVVTASFSISFYVRYIAKTLESEISKAAPILVGPIAFGLYFAFVEVLL